MLNKVQGNATAYDSNYTVGSLKSSGSGRFRKKQETGQSRIEHPDRLTRFYGVPLTYSGRTNVNPWCNVDTWVGTGCEGDKPVEHVTIFPVVQCRTGEKEVYGVVGLDVAERGIYPLGTYPDICGSNPAPPHTSQATPTRPTITVTANGTAAPTSQPTVSPDTTTGNAGTNMPISFGTLPLLAVGLHLFGFLR